MLIAVINPISGGGRARRLAEKFFQRAPLLLKKWGLGSMAAGSFPQIETDAEGVWLRRLKEKLHETGGGQFVLVFGGDGTLSQAACAVHEAALPKASTLCLVPGGRGNDFTRALYGQAFSEEDFWAWAAQKAWTAKPLDLGLCNKMPFLNMASVGYGGKVVENAHRRRAFWSGSAAVYQIEGALALWGEKNIHGVVHAVDNSGASRAVYEGDVFGAFVGNGRANGGGLFWTPSARLDDGQLDLVVFQKPGFLEMLKALNEIKAGRDPAMMHQRASALRFTFAFEEAVAMDLDGEYRGRNDKIEFSTLPSALHVLS